MHVPLPSLLTGLLAAGSLVAATAISPRDYRRVYYHSDGTWQPAPQRARPLFKNYNGLVSHEVCRIEGDHESWQQVKASRCVAIDKEAEMQVYKAAQCEDRSQAKFAVYGNGDCDGEPSAVKEFGLGDGKVLLGACLDMSTFWAGEEGEVEEMSYAFWCSDDARKVEEEEEEEEEEVKPEEPKRPYRPSVSIRIVDFMHKYGKGLTIAIALVSLVMVLASPFILLVGAIKLTRYIVRKLAERRAQRTERAEGAIKL